MSDFAAIPIPAISTSALPYQPSPPPRLASLSPTPPSQPNLSLYSSPRFGSLSIELGRTGHDFAPSPPSVVNPVSSALLPAPSPQPRPSGVLQGESTWGSSQREDDGFSHRSLADASCSAVGPESPDTSRDLAVPRAISTAATDKMVPGTTLETRDPSLAAPSSPSAAPDPRVQPRACGASLGGPIERPLPCSGASSPRPLATGPQPVSNASLTATGTALFDWPTSQTARTETQHPAVSWGPTLHASASAIPLSYPPPFSLPPPLQQSALALLHFLATTLPSLPNPLYPPSHPSFSPFPTRAPYPYPPFISHPPGVRSNAPPNSPDLTSTPHYASIAGTSFPLIHPPQVARVEVPKPPQSSLPPTLKRSSSAPSFPAPHEPSPLPSSSPGLVNSHAPTAISAWSKPLPQSLRTPKPISLPLSMPSPIWDAEEASLVFSKDMEDAGHLSLQHAVLGRFVGSRPSMEWLEHHVNLHWSLSSHCKLSLLSKNQFLFRFSSAADKQRILSKSPLSLQKSKLHLQSWHPNVELGTWPSKVPVWVRIKGLLPHQWTTDIIFTIANVLGTPLKVDSHTASQTYMTFARVCVDLDPSAPRPAKVKLQFPSGASGEVYLEIENPPCSLCAKRGHVASRCNRASGQSTLKVAPAISSPNTPQPSVLGKAPQPALQIRSPPSPKPHHPTPNPNQLAPTLLTPPAGDKSKDHAGHPPQNSSTPSPLSANPFALLDSACAQLAITNRSPAHPDPSAVEAQLADVDWLFSTSLDPSTSAAAPTGFPPEAFRGAVATKPFTTDVDPAGVVARLTCATPQEDPDPLTRQDPQPTPSSVSHSLPVPPAQGTSSTSTYSPSSEDATFIPSKRRQGRSKTKAITSSGPVTRKKSSSSKSK